MSQRKSFQAGDYRIVAMITQAPGVLWRPSGFSGKECHRVPHRAEEQPRQIHLWVGRRRRLVSSRRRGSFQPQGIRQRIIPYSGADQTVTAFISRTIDIYGGAIATIAPFVAEGKAKCLLLTTARRFCDASRRRKP